MKRPLDSTKPSVSAPRDESKLSSARLSEKKFNKKRFWLIVTILALVEAGILYVALQWKYIFPSREVSDLYTRYENVDGVEASFIKDYKVNDTVFVDVTLLEAKTDTAWTVLKREFNITPPPQEVIDFAGEIDIVTWLAPKKDYSQPMDTVLLNNDLITISWRERQISVFAIETNEQMIAVAHNQIKESITRSQISNNKKNEQNN